ncbi:protease 2 isoform X2 [Macadamia integrifolia]|uniref:protease 2 isoform X2 n=1 Tax=Macadamia integrifolia TaxID=60698 RepID=UPI001C4F3CA4|nr:protease 2 isoform X2 [Macadamia integrifolia]
MLLIRRSSFRLLPRVSSSITFFSSTCNAKVPSFTSPETLPPVPKKIPFTVSAHGRTWEDPYHWMSNSDDPDLLNYLNQENLYAEAFMADTENLQRELLLEMQSRMTPKISTPPERWGPWFYYQYIPEGKEFPVLCRKLADCKSDWMNKLVNYVKGLGREQTLLDWNEIAQKFGYVHVGMCRVSPDHNFLAYTLDTTGAEYFMLQIKDLRTGCILPKSRIDGVVSLAWAQDLLFYTVSNETQRPDRVLCTRPGSDVMDSNLIFTESDSSCCVDISGTKDGKFITVNSNSRTSSEVYVIDANNPQNELQRVRKRVPGVQYFLEHHHGFFYILTNASCGEDTGLVSGGYHLARCSAEDIQSSIWQDIIVPDQDVSFQDMDIFNGHLVLFLDKRGSPMICSIGMPIVENYKCPLKLNDLNPWFFPVPAHCCNVAPGSNHDFMTSIYRVVLSSPVMPDVIIDYDMLEKKFLIVQQEELVGGVSGSTRSCSRTFVYNKCDEKVLGIHTHDDQSILNARQKGHSPGLLIGYGAYGEVLDKSWCANRLSLLDRGWVVAFADVRGGSGGDSTWHKAGSGMCKLNCVYDFIACGKYLVNEGYVHKDRLGAMTFSAGGLVVGAAINMYPDLFRAAILKVPFLDICNTLLDPSLPLTVLDYEEFGDPRVQTQFESIFGYSPYDNIPPGVCHPSMLVTTSFHDSRVGVWEGAKWVAKLRETTCSSCSRSVILKTNMSGGHFGEGGRFSQCEETAYEYAFLMKVTGMLNAEKYGGF